MGAACSAAAWWQHPGLIECIGAASSCSGLLDESAAVCSYRILYRTVAIGTFPDRSLSVDGRGRLIFFPSLDGVECFEHGTKATVSGQGDRNDLTLLAHH